MSTDKKPTSRRAIGAGLPARQARATSASADTLAKILVELQQLRMELKARDAYYEAVGMPLRPLARE